MPKRTKSEDAPPSCGTDVEVDALILGLIAGEMDDTRRAMEDVTVALCGDARIVQQHGEFLQSIDELAQRLENLARVMRSRPMEGAIDAVTLESLRNRLLDGVTDSLAQRASGGEGANFWTSF